MQNKFIEQAKAVMVGHAIGDALGVPVEFTRREVLDETPVTDMLGYGTYSVPEGAWSDDTSMSLCALESLAKGKIDYDDVMTNFGRWYYRNEFTATGKLFDVGNTCSRAIFNYFIGKVPYNRCGIGNDTSNGNGSLMRIHPFVLYTANKGSVDGNIEVIHTASALTHAHKRSKIGCGIYAFILWELLKNPVRDGIYAGLRKARKYYEGEEELGYYDRLFSESFISTERKDISSSGYVVDSLEAAVWCLLNTDSYKDCVLKAVNLGGDTDTVAAIAGGLAGALYGYGNIPQEWKDTLIRRDMIESLCEKAFG